ncbi:MAG: hypothetical protein ACOYKN_11240 [Pirellula sp.]
MKFSESQDPWRGVPEWASFLIDFGFAWIVQPVPNRRIAVVTMPADSAAAGLITLGAMRKCLELDDANDVDSHYRRLLDIAHARPPGVQLRFTDKRDRFKFYGFDEKGNPIVKNVTVTWFQTRTITRSDAMKWRVYGEAPVAVLNGQKVPHSQIYNNLVKNGGEIKPSNLSQSHSQICLAGRSVGETRTRECIANIRFQNEGCEADLSYLLTVQGWMPGTVSRVMFYNARTDEFDRQQVKPQVVIADGDASFLTVVDGSDFEHSDVIGVIHRTMERDRLEAVGTKLENLRQWYEQSALVGLPQSPRGIGISVLARRQSCQ